MRLGIVAFAVCAAGAACAQALAAEPPVLRYESSASGPGPLRFAVHPLHNPKRLLEAYAPLADVLQRSAQPGRLLQVEASRSYAAFEDKIRRREPDVILPNPWQALLALAHGYRVIAMAGEPEDFRGLFLVRTDSPIRKPADLKGQTVAYPSPTAVAAAMLPQWFLHEHGLRVDVDVRSTYVGSQESALLQVWSGQVAAAATWLPPWRSFQRAEPEKAASLRVIWRTAPLPNNAVMVRDDLPDDVVQRLRDALLSLHERPDGRTTLAAAQTSRFYPADASTYAPVRAFIERFARDVRPVPRIMGPGGKVSAP